MAVVVQRMVAAEAAGVMMTLEPVNGDRTTIYIESAFGLGEGVVRGDVATDAFWVDKARLGLHREEIRAKSQAHRLDTVTGTVSFVDVPRTEQGERSLAPAEVLALAELGRRIEERFQRPMDIEWAIASDGSAGRRIFMLQARPETVWSNRPAGAPAQEPGGFDALDAWDPLHTTSAPHLHWSRSNVGEAMPGVQTPLSWSVWSHGVEHAPRHAAFTIGAVTREERLVPADVNDRILQIFFGRVAMRVEFLTMLGDRMPGTSGQDVAKSVFGHIPADIAYRPTKRRYPVVAWRLPAAFAVTPRRARAFAADTDAWYRTRLATLESLDLDATREQLRRAMARFDEAIALQTVVLLAVVQPLYDVLERLIAKTGVGDVATLSGTGGAEMAIVSDLWEAAQGRRPLKEVISAHGFHGPLEGELSSRVWREDDRPLHLLLESYAQRNNPVRAGLDDERRRQQQALVAALPAFERPAARLLLRLAAKRILLRGVIKRSFLQAFDVIRALARHAGDLLAAEGRLDAADDVFFLTVDELLGDAPPDVADLISRRRDRHAAYERIELPLEWTGMPVPVSGDDTSPVDGTGDVGGTGVSRGVVEGRARVLTRPDFESVEPGEILVSPTTDPSWSSIMFISAALVVDIGGALSHAAVVARELGIPCVVSTRDGTRRLRTGDRLRVDGGTGTVTILERAPL
jgi:pyruvate,water dikinase